MRIQSLIYNDVKEELIRNWRKNEKWLVYPVIKSRPNFKSLKFATNLYTANLFCAQQASRGRYWRYIPLVDVLRSMNSVHSNQKAKAINLDFLIQQVYQYPIEEMIKDKLLSSLVLGEICPAFWRKIVNPLSVIRLYHVVEIFFQNENSYSTKKTWIPCVTCKEAISLFKKTANSHATYKRKGRYNCYLIGQIKTKLLLNKKGMPLANTGVILMATSIGENFENDILKIILVNDFTSPLILKQPILIRYNLKKLKLEFFDDKLCRAKPGAELDYFDVKYFGFADPLSFIYKW